MVDEAGKRTPRSYHESTIEMHSARGFAIESSARGRTIERLSNGVPAGRVRAPATAAMTTSIFIGVPCGCPTLRSRNISVL